MKVILRVYNIGDPEIVKLLNNVLKKEFLGIWHTSIEVYGKEFFYDNQICKVLPNCSKHKIPHTIHDMGTTEILEEEFELFLANLNEKYGLNTYDLLFNNCNHFTNDCILFLVNKSIPSYITDVHVAL